MNWEGRSDRYFDPPDERFRTVERDPDQLIDDYQEREMKDEIFSVMTAVNEVAHQGMKSGVEIGRQESAARIKELEADKAELLASMKIIQLRANSEEPAEELDDAQRDLRHIFATATSAIAKSEKQAERVPGEV
jgi:hypothetical protein